MMVMLLCAVLAAESPGSTDAAEQLRFFETNVRPVLVEHCQECHGAKKQWGSLRLDSRDALLQGGDRGPAIVPGDPENSLLIRAVQHVDPDLQMPEEGKLADRQIADLQQWIQDGAHFPAAQTAATETRDPDHWAFQPPAAGGLPAVENGRWPATAVDYFVLAKLEAAGLQPAPEADRRTLIRRVTYDLTGLPPTPEEIDAFLNDQRPAAYTRLIDRLLASPAYGERWGRRWLDVARYADSNGLDENIAHGNAWRYRDYVVGAFNQDKPFDQFIKEQLAGDLLPATSQAQQHELLIATGFLAIGPKVLAEVDQSKMRMDIVDEQIDTVGRVFMGMTFGCARCHDHKFDPIDTADYYGLAGIFKSTRTMETYTKIARWHEHLLPSEAATKMQADYDAQLAAKKQVVAEFIAAADEQARSALGPKCAPEELEQHYPEATKAELAKLREELATLEKNPPELPAAMGVTEDQITDVPIHVRGNPLKLGAIVRRRTPTVMQGPAAARFSADESGRRELAEWLIAPHHPLTARVLVNRVWRWHFGRGIVRTTENFGLLGERPTHPELLDWLARHFIASGWSLKSLHRMILHSSTYRQSSSPDPQTVVADPENQWFSRAAVRRLEAEEFRDALLAISGQLDRSFSGPSLKVKNRGHLFDHTSIDTTDYTSRRRSLYLPIIRNNVYDVFQLLDYPDPAVPTGDRAATTVAPQALLMLNSDLVMDAADHFAQQLLAEGTDIDQRIDRMYQIAYGRPATDGERAGHRAFLAEVEQTLAGSAPANDDRQRDAMSILCHLVLAANEFIYLQ